MRFDAGSMRRIDSRSEGIRREMNAIDRSEVQRLLDLGAQLVDVLSADEYAEDHLPGAISLPLKQLDAETARRLDRERPVIVYCHDYQ
jgi:rhodanese-related sulfurtransferase